MAIRDLVAAFVSAGKNWQVWLAFAQAIIAAWRNAQAQVAQSEGRAVALKAVPLSDDEVAELEAGVNELRAGMPADGRLHAFPMLEMLREIAALVKAYPEVAGLLKMGFELLKQLMQGGTKPATT